MEYFHVERHFYGDHWDDWRYDIGRFNDRYRDDLDIPNELNTTEPKALDACIDWFDVSETGFGEDSEPIFFAALALKHVEKALWYLDQSVNPDTKRLAEIEAGAKEALGLEPEEDLPEFDRSFHFDYRFACESAMDALEAVTMADKYGELNWLKRDFAKRALKAMSAAEKEHREKQEAAEARNKKERMALLSARRKEIRLEAKALVLAHWEADTSRFIGPKEAGEYYSVWLRDIPGKKFKFAWSTCRDWISERAAERGIRWR